MKKSLLLVSAYIFTFIAIQNCTSPKNNLHTCRMEVLQQIVLLKQLLTSSMLPMANNNTGTTALQTAFTKARHQYKQMEWAVEYYMPTTARFVNGPALDELEIEENKAVPPEGFQVVEELLYPAYDTVYKEELVRNIKLMIGACERMKKHFEVIEFSKEQVTDAVRLQLYRIITLGVTGFDAPVSLTSIKEASISLQQLQHVTELVLAPVITTSAKTFAGIIQQFQQAAVFCNSNTDFNSFNRAVFITQHINPLCRSLYQYQQQEQIAFINDGRYYRSNAATLFEKNGFDVNGFIPGAEYRFSEEKKLLGEKLFYDPVLSGNNQRSCGSCHQPKLAFSDGLSTSASLGGGFIQRNAPSVSYAALQHGQFWDMRRSDLESQTTDVIENKNEMHGSLQNAVASLQKNVVYQRLFQEAFPQSAGIEAWQVQNALSSYIRSLATFTSSFDRYMNGHTNAMDEQQVNGFNLFMGKAKCGTCHFMPLFNGTVPPAFAKTESEVLGTPSDALGKTPDTDKGRYVMHPMPQLLRSFKTPTVRNASLTAPYMHNGVYKTLEQVMDFYNKGGGEGLGLKTENQTLPADRLQLSESEIKSIIAFMSSLTDELTKLRH
jgi:cytochrome c peroxidase